jgi:serine protease Do
MAEPEEVTCPTCRHAVVPAAVLCPHCGAALVVDVLLRSPITSSGARYRLSRALGGIPGAPALRVIRARLEARPPAAARGVRVGHARAVLSVLSESGFAGTIEKHTSPAREIRSALRGAAVGMAAVAVLAVAWVAGRGVLRQPTPPALAVAHAAGTATDGRARSPRELAHEVLGAAAALRCRDTGGSGFFVEPDLVVTNSHVICGDGDRIQVGLSDDRKLVGVVVRRDETLDLGLVRVVGANARPLPLGDVADLAVGDRVVIVGSPVGLDFTVQEGSVSNLQRSANGVAYLQLDAKVSPGNSGGPVVDSAGRVVAVVAMKVSGEGVEGIGLALPINYLYAAATTFAKPPSGAAADSEAFRQMVARAAQRAGDLVQEAHLDVTPEGPAVEERPLLVGGHVDQHDNLVVRVARVADVPPALEEITVTLWSGLDAFCTVKGDIRKWTLVDPTLAVAGLDPSAASVLGKVAGGRALYLGESPLRWDLCDRTRMKGGVEVQLEGASPLASRLEVARSAARIVHEAARSSE